MGSTGSGTALCITTIHKGVPEPVEPNCLKKTSSKLPKRRVQYLVTGETKRKRKIQLFSSRQVVCKIYYVVYRISLVSTSRFLYINIYGYMKQF